MKYYIPQLQLGVLSPPQTTLEDKFGGLPWGLPSRTWPICRQCGKPMQLLAQFIHDEQRLHLGRAGRCLFVFMCANPDSTCEGTWDSTYGSNTSFVVESEDLAQGLTYPPDVTHPQTATIRSVHNVSRLEPWDSGRTIWIETEVRVMNQREGWAADDKAIWSCDGPNFGDAGVGYLFLKCVDDSLPECDFLWQCH